MELIYYILAGFLIGFATVAVVSAWRGLQAEKRQAALEAEALSNTQKEI